MNNGLISRMLRAAKLDVKLYEEVEADQRATAQAMLVVVLSSLAAGVGSMGMGSMGAGAGFGPAAFFFGTLAALVGWVVWSLVTYLIGTRLLPEAGTKANVGELLRTTGFSAAPGIIRILGVIPGLWLISTGVALVWSLIAMVIAVRQALDYQTTSRAVAVCLLGWILSMMLAWILSGPPLYGPV